MIVICFITIWDITRTASRRRPRTHPSGVWAASGRRLRGVLGGHFSKDQKWSFWSFGHFLEAMSQKTKKRSFLNKKEANLLKDRGIF